MSPQLMISSTRAALHIGFNTFLLGVSFKRVFVHVCIRLHARVSYSRVCQCVYVAVITNQSKVFAAERDRGAKLKGTFVSS